MHRSIIAGLFAVVLGGGLAVAQPGFAVEIIDPGQGAVDLPRAGSRASGLSGITYAGADRYFAVSDRGARLFELEIRIDPESGRIVASSIDRLARLASARDTEGVAFAEPGSVWVADEVGPAVREHSIDDGSVLRSLAIPKMYRKARRNRSLESLSLDPAAGALWIANEEALSVDGPQSNAETGTLVRLQRFERFERFERDGTEQAVWSPAEQWAYRTDAIPGEPLGHFALSGVVDLLAVPDGPLLVLERGLGSEGIRCRIYEIDGTHATDTSVHPGLDGLAVTPVQKRLLWEGAALGDNFEGMALGPPLAATERSLVLISDDGGATQPRLYPLVLRLEAEPAPTADSSGPPMPGSPAASLHPPEGKMGVVPVAAAIAATSLLGVWWLWSRAAQGRKSR